MGALVKVWRYETAEWRSISFSMSQDEGPEADPGMMLSFVAGGHLVVHFGRRIEAVLFTDLRCSAYSA